MSRATTAGCWHRDSGLPFQRLDEEMIVVDPRRREVHLLNETAARIWELLAAPSSLDELASSLGAEYDADGDELRTAILDCLTGLSDKGLVSAPGAAR
jgi:PqqD family protein of HPr-rel-A system